MSRAAKTTLVASIIVSGLTVWGVHFMQIQERATMYKGVERDEARQAAKRAQRQADLLLNQEREARFQDLQPTAAASSNKRNIVAYSMLEEAEKKAGYFKEKAGSLLEKGGVGDDEDRRYIAGRWGLDGLQVAAVAATPIYFINLLRGRGGSLKRLARTNFVLPVLGGAAGYGSGYVYAQQLDATTAAQKSFAYRHDPYNTIRDDHYIIGGVIGALLTPAIFLGRTGLLNGVLGGGLGLGGTAGMGYDYYQRNFAGKTPQQIRDAAKAADKETGGFLSQARGKAEEVRGKAEETLGKGPK